VVNESGIIINDECYIPSRLGGDGSDGIYYGPDFKTCEDKSCPTCPSPTPTPTSSNTPTITTTPTPTVTPTNPYYLTCDVITRDYVLVCNVETNEYTLECDSIISSPTPTITPTVTPTVTPSEDIPISISSTPSTPTPTITPSTTTGDKTIYVYYPNL
jgi:hypothetical protein